jgi:ATP-dependent RNA helicase RhlE
MLFTDLGLSDRVLRALQPLGYTEPTPIQAQAIPHVLAGTDVLGCAQTGTGKTAAFALPMVDLLSRQRHEGRRVIRGLILTPTRELANQIQDNLKAYAVHTGLRSTLIYGGVGQGRQVEALNRGVDIVVATPGRLLDLINQGYASLRHLEYLVLDEADTMLDMGFIHDIKKIIAMLPERRQSLFFSATMPPAILSLASTILRDPVRVEVTPISSTTELVDQRMYFVPQDDKRVLLADMLALPEVSSALVFTRTKHGADKVVKYLNQQGIKSEAIHGNKSQPQRDRAMQGFRSGSIRVLVATDIAARGIDVEEISHVFNFELPNIPETYVHRIGRTGRAGATGIAVSFCNGDDEPEFLRDIQKLIGKDVPVVTDHPYHFDLQHTRRGKAISSSAPAGNSRPQRSSHSSRPRPSGSGYGSGYGSGSGRSEGNRNRSGRPEGSRSGSGRPEGSRSGSGRPEGSRSGSSRPEGSRSGSGRPEGSRSGSSRPEGSRSGDQRNQGNTAPQRSRPADSGNAPKKRSSHPHSNSDSRSNSNSNSRSNSNSNSNSNSSQEKARGFSLTGLFGLRKG